MTINPTTYPIQRRGGSGPENLNTGGGDVDSVFGRTGVVVANDNDYNSDQIENVSTVTGASVTDALEWLAANAGAVDSVFGRTGAVIATLGDYTAVLITNNGTNVPGSTVQAALDNLKSGVANDVNTVSGTSYSFILTDAGKYVRFTNGAPVPVTVPRNSTIAFPVGTLITGVQAGAGQVTFVPEDGTVTINTAETLKTRVQQSGWSLKKVDTNVWDLVGDLELA